MYNKHIHEVFNYVYSRDLQKYVQLSSLVQHKSHLLSKIRVDHLVRFASLQQLSCAESSKDCNVHVQQSILPQYLIHT